MSPITGPSPIGSQSRFRPGNAPSSGNGLDSANHPNRLAQSSPDSAADNTDLSQFAELMSGLRLVAQTDPGQFQAILAEIGASISNAAEDASAAGNTTAAGMVAQLESDFSDASTAVQPKLQNSPAQA